LKLEDIRKDARVRDLKHNKPMRLKAWLARDSLSRLTHPDLRP
jgi:hypothetical protein